MSHLSEIYRSFIDDDDVTISRTRIPASQRNDYLVAMRCCILSAVLYIATTDAPIGRRNERWACPMRIHI
jgi:hypothetical protein